MNGVLAFEVPKTKMAEAARVASIVALSGIVLHRVNASNDADTVDAPSPCECRIMHRTLGYATPSPGRLVVETEAKVELLPSTVAEGKQQASTTPLITIAVIYANHYDVPDGEMPAELQAALPSFAELNGLFNAWPFLRQQIQAISSEMGHPITLPTMKIAPQKAKRTAKKITAAKSKS